jgi:hypothetical protein
VRLTRIQVVPALGVAAGRVARVAARLNPGPPLSAVAQEEVYRMCRGLAAASELLLRALVPSTVSRQDSAAVAVEFMDWISRCGRGCTWATCTPDDQRRLYNDMDSEKKLCKAGYSIEIGVGQ